MDFGFEIINWYLDNKRDLPWRNTKNPYEIWVSEILLQQTRVDQALGYYILFIRKFPDVATLANATQQELLKLWQGLGYYSRARNMHFTAKHVATELDGIFPDSFLELLKLKGIGAYTAAAIASFAFNESVPVLDGNVYRVLSRFFAESCPINSTEGKKIFKELAAELIKTHAPAVYNQAIMEFGALQCVPKNPNCSACPLNNACLGYLKNKVKELPIKSNKTKKRDRFLNYLFIDNQTHTFIHKRNEKDIWNGLYEFPLIETDSRCDFKQLTERWEWTKLLGSSTMVLESTSANILHLLTHQRIHAVFHKLSFHPDNKFIGLDKLYDKVNFDDLQNYPVPKIIDNYLIREGIL